MWQIIKKIILVLSLSTLTYAYAADLTQESVKRFITKIDNAVKTQNVQEIANTLSNDVELFLHVNILGQQQLINPSKQEYIEMVQVSWMYYTDYEYSRSNTVIKINGDKALVTSIIKEVMKFQGQQMSGETKEEMTVEMVNGIPLITKITGSPIN